MLLASVGEISADEGSRGALAGAVESLGAWMAGQGEGENMPRDVLGEIREVAGRMAAGLRKGAVEMPLEDDPMDY